MKTTVSGGVKLYLEPRWLLFPKSHWFFSLALDLSQLCCLSPVPPFLKVNCPFIFPTSSFFSAYIFHSAFFFSLSDIACFCFLHFLNFSNEAELVELGRKPFKYVWKCNRETILTRENLALNSVRSSPKKQEMGYKSQVLSGGWIPRIPPINVCPRDSEMLVESWSNGVVLF